VRADYRQRIKDLRERLDRLDDADAAVRDARRESSFHLVALAGYTNAGKSKLLRRLADDLDVEENDHRHDDLRETAASRDRLFETLNTTTRRVTVGDRRVLLTWGSSATPGRTAAGSRRRRCTPLPSARNRCSPPTSQFRVRSRS
jgi:GTP-binding protein HflX